MIAFIIILLLVIALGVGIYFFTKDSTSEEAQEKDDTPVILVTDEGSVYKNKPNKTEGYYVPIDDTALSPYRVVAYDVNSPNARGGAPATVWKDGKCVLDGTLDCLHYQRVKDGKVVAFTNDKGEDLLEKLANDLYSGKLVINEEVTTGILKQSRLNDDGTLQWKRNDCSEGEIEKEKNDSSVVERRIAMGVPLCNTWTTIRVNENPMMGIANYIFTILIHTKLKGIPKPKIELNVTPKNFKVYNTPGYADTPTDATEDARMATVYEEAAGGEPVQTVG
jgi:hypothetical protein